MTHSLPPVAVIGGGVIGLTSAIRLAEAGFPVSLFARALSPHTTSDIAAAFWAPSATADNARTKQWALTSLVTLQELAADPASGIVLTDLYSLTDVPTDMTYMASAGARRAVVPGAFPAPWAGWCATVPRMDVPLYMPWLLARLHSLGVQMHPHIFQTFQEIHPAYTLVVNCTGLGAQALTGDAVYPIRGQVISVRKPDGLAPEIIYANYVNNEMATTYIIPRSRDCLLGGTYQYRNGDVTVDLAIAEQILARCAVFNPAFAQPEVLQHKVGLRPGRQAVRLEQERFASGRVIIHNYGHGSVGHTLAWGCAAEVVKLASAAVAGGSNPVKQ